MAETRQPTLQAKLFPLISHVSCPRKLPVCYTIRSSKSVIFKFGRPSRMFLPSAWTHRPLFLKTLFSLNNHQNEEIN